MNCCNVTFNSLYSPQIYYQYGVHLHLVSFCWDFTAHKALLPHSPSEGCHYHSVYGCTAAQAFIMVRAEVSACSKWSVLVSWVVHWSFLSAALDPFIPWWMASVCMCCCMLRALDPSLVPMLRTCNTCPTSCSGRLHFLGSIPFETLFSWIMDHLNWMGSSCCFNECSMLVFRACATSSLRVFIW